MAILILLVFALWMPTNLAWSAVAVDTVQSGTNTASSTLSVSTTVNSGSDRVLICGVAWGNTQTVSTVVFNTSESLTRVGGALKGTGEGADIWILKNPSVTTANVTVTMTAAPSIGLTMGCLSLNGVDQTTSTSGLQTLTGSVNPDPQPSVTVTSSTNDLVFDVLETNGDGTITVGAGQTSRWTLGNANHAGFGSTEPGASSVTMSWSALANFTAYAYAAVNIAQAAGGGGPNMDYIRRRVQ